MTRDADPDISVGFEWQCLLWRSLTARNQLVQPVARPVLIPTSMNRLVDRQVNRLLTLSLLVECPSKEVRDAIMESGMDIGMQEAWAKLEEVASSLR